MIIHRLHVFAGILALVALLSGCGRSDSNVENGAKGATSPLESGQHGVRSRPAPPTGGPADGANAEHPSGPTATENTVLHEAFSNGNTDATMENSGNLAGQGNYASRQKAAAGPQTGL